MAYYIDRYYIGNYNSVGLKFTSIATVTGISTSVSLASGYWYSVVVVGAGGGCVANVYATDKWYSNTYTGGSGGIVICTFYLNKTNVTYSVSCGIGGGYKKMASATSTPNPGTTCIGTATTFNLNYGNTNMISISAGGGNLIRSGITHGFGGTNTITVNPSQLSESFYDVVGFSGIGGSVKSSFPNSGLTVLESEIPQCKFPTSTSVVPLPYYGRGGYIDSSKNTHSGQSGAVLIYRASNDGTGISTCPEEYISKNRVVYTSTYKSISI